MMMYPIMGTSLREEHIMAKYVAKSLPKLDGDYAVVEVRAKSYFPHTRTSDKKEAQAAAHIMNAEHYLETARALMDKAHNLHSKGAKPNDAAIQALANEASLTEDSTQQLWRAVSYYDNDDPYVWKC
jgi:hypothetical protein